MILLLTVMHKFKFSTTNPHNINSLFKETEEKPLTLLRHNFLKYIYFLVYLMAALYTAIVKDLNI